MRDKTRRHASILNVDMRAKKDSNQMFIDEQMKIIANVGQRFEERQASLVALDYVCSEVKQSGDSLNGASDIQLKFFFNNRTELTLPLLILLGQCDRMRCFRQRDETNVNELIDKIRGKIRRMNETKRIESNQRKDHSNSGNLGDL
jgi:hypothetical protein